MDFLWSLICVGVGFLVGFVVGEWYSFCGC